MTTRPSRSTALQATLGSLILALGPLAVGSAQAESFASSASSAGSASVGSSSDSIKGSSNSSSNDKPVAQGEYRIEKVTVLPADGAHPERVQLHMVPAQAAAQGEARDFYLAMPRQVYDAQGLAVQATLRADVRDYGLAFARADAPQPFYLVLDDTWRNDLDPRAVRL